MSEGPVGAGAGIRKTQQQSFFKPNLRAPTKDEKEELELLLQILEENLAEGTYGFRDIFVFLVENPDVRINDVYAVSEDGSPFYKDTLNMYGILMLSPMIDTNNKLLEEVMRRMPDPLKISASLPKLTLLDALRNEIEGEDDPATIALWNRKLQLAKDYQDRYTAKLLSSLSEVSQNFFVKKQLGSNLEGKILETLTSESGILPIQLSKYRVKAGLPGVVNKSPANNPKQGGKGKKSYKRRNLRGKTKSKKTRN